MQQERVNKEFQGVAPLNSKWGKKPQIQIKISHSLHQTLEQMIESTLTGTTCDKNALRGPLLQTCVNKVLHCVQDTCSER